MELSSREILELNQNLESAQHIAGLGYWTHNLETGSIFWSKELKSMLQLASTFQEPSFVEFLDMVHPNDRTLLKTSVEEALSAGKKYSLELRIKDFVIIPSNLQDQSLTRSRATARRKEIIYGCAGTFRRQIGSRNKLRSVHWTICATSCNNRTINIPPHNI